MHLKLFADRHKTSKKNIAPPLFNPKQKQQIWIQRASSPNMWLVYKRVNKCIHTKCIGHVYYRNLIHKQKYIPKLPLAVWDTESTEWHKTLKGIFHRGKQYVDEVTVQTWGYIGHLL